MGTLVTYDFEGIDGATLAGSGIALQGTGTAIHSAANSVVGATGGKCTATDALTRSARLTITVPSLTMACSVYVTTPQVTSTIGTAVTIVTLRNTTPGVAVRIMYNPTSSTLGDIGVQGVTGGFRTVATGVGLGVMLRWEVLLVVATASTGTITAKAYSSAGPWTTLLGTFTNAVFDAGTVAIGTVDVGALTALTPGQVVGFDYARMEDGRVTEFGPPPSASAPTANPGSSQYVVAGTVVTLTGTASTAGTGSITGYSWVCTSFPAGATSPAITTPTGSTATATLAAGGRYTFSLTVTQTGGLTNTASVTEYVYEQSNIDVDVFSVGTTIYTNEGGAASLLAALNDISQATFAQSPANPTGQTLPVTMNPFGPGTISIFVEGNYSGTTLTRTVNVYKEDGTTLIYTTSYALTTTAVDHEVILDSTALAAIPALSDRRALVVKISEA